MAERLREIATTHGFGDQLALLQRYVLPCIGFTLEVNSGGAVGSSRLGGGPDLPSSFDWPTNKGRPLDFLLQVNLTDVAPLDSVRLFPRSGLLLFFYDLEEQPWGYDPKDLGGYAVRFVPETSDLRRYPPAHAQTALPEAILRFWPSETLPNYRSRAGYRLMADLKTEMAGEPESDVLDAYIELSAALFRASAPTPDGPSHHLGGHSDNIQGDMQLEAQLVTNGLYCGDGSGYFDPRRIELERSCEDWSLLLQLDSDEDAGFMWGDCGMLYYWVRSTDLARREVTKAWMTLQCY